MEVTINIPVPVFAALSVSAKQSHRPINEVIIESIEQQFVKEAETLEQQISRYADQEVLELAQIQMPARQNRRVSLLLQKQNAGKLSEKEEKEMWELIHLGRLATLKKAIALLEISRRKIEVEN
jgi:hypothetical protein